MKFLSNIHNRLLAAVIVLFIVVSQSEAYLSCDQLIDSSNTSVALLPAPELIFTPKYQEELENLNRQPNVLKYIQTKYPYLHMNEIISLRMYTSSYYQKLNPALRQKKYTREFNEAAYYINSALQKMPQNITPVYRGVEKMELEFLQKFKIGDRFTFGDFKSTSLRKDFAEDWTNINTIIEFINTPSTIIKDISVLGSTEQEALISPNLNFVVVDIVDYQKQNYARPFKKFVLEAVK